MTRPAHEPGPLEIVRGDGSARSEVFVAPDAAIGFLPRFDTPEEYVEFCRTVPLNDDVLVYTEKALDPAVIQARQDDIATYVEDSMPTITATADERFGTEDSPEKAAFIESERTRYADYVLPQVEERIPYITTRSDVPAIARASLLNARADLVPDAQVTVYGETMTLTEAREKYAHTRCLDAARQGMRNYAAALGDRPTGALIRQAADQLNLAVNEASIHNERGLAETVPTTRLPSRRPKRTHRTRPRPPQHQHRAVRGHHPEEHRNRIRRHDPLLTTRRHHQPATPRKVLKNVLASEAASEAIGPTQDRVVDGVPHRTGHPAMLLKTLTPTREPYTPATPKPSTAMTHPARFPAIREAPATETRNLSRTR